METHTHMRARAKLGERHHTNFFTHGKMHKYYENDGEMSRGLIVASDSEERMMKV